MSHKRFSKLIRIGNTSIAVILPKEWLRYNNLKSGNYVEMISDKTVIIKILPKKGDGG